MGPLNIYFPKECNIYDDILLRMCNGFFRMVRDIFLCLCHTVPTIAHQNKVIHVFDRAQLRIVESKSKCASNNHDTKLCVAGDMDDRLEYFLD